MRAFNLGGCDSGFDGAGIPGYGYVVLGTIQSLFKYTTLSSILKLDQFHIERR